MKNYNELLKILEERFNKNPNRHKDVSWEEILEIISKNDKRLYSITYQKWITNWIPVN